MHRRAVPDVRFFHPDQLHPLSTRVAVGFLGRNGNGRHRQPAEAGPPGVGFDSPTAKAMDQPAVPGLSHFP